MTEILLSALMAGLLLVVACAPLGTIVVWRRMAYFGDALAHGALFGVALGLIFGLNSMWAMMLSALLIALLLMGLEKNRTLPVDSLLGMFSTGGLALGIVCYHLAGAPQGDLYSYLFGDILAVGKPELLWMSIAAALVVLLAWRYWSALVLWVLHADMAAVEGVPVRKLQGGVTIMVALVIALAIKLVGVLLVTAMLVVPPLTARPLVHSPSGMVFAAAVFGTFNVVAGLAVSYYVDVPAGPAMVAVGVCSFFVTYLAKKLFTTSH